MSGNFFDQFDELPPERSPGEKVARAAIAPAQGANSGLYKTVMALPDLSAMLMKSLGLSDANAPLPSQRIQQAGQAARDELGVTYNPNITPETTTERVLFDVGDAAGQTAGMVIPGMGMANTAAKPAAMGLNVAAPNLAKVGSATVPSVLPTYGQTVGQTIASNPYLQFVAGSAGNVTTDFTGNPYLGMAASMATPLAVQGAQRAVSAAPAATGAEAERRALLNDAKGMGIVPSFGTIANSTPAKFFESVVQKLPFMGGTQTRINEANKTAFNRKAFDLIPQTAGEGIDAATTGTVDAVKARIGKIFNGLEDATTVNIDPKVRADLAAAKADFSQQLLSQMPASIGKKLDELIGMADQVSPGNRPGEYLPVPSSTTQTNVTLDGATYKNIRSKLSAQLASAQGTDKTTIGKMIDALDGAVERSLPKDMVKDWQDARLGWRRISTIDDAVNARRNPETAVGNIPPGALAARAGSDADMERLAKVGTAFVGDKMPDSGTANRMLIQNAMGLGAGGAGAMTFPMTTAALAGGGYLANLAMNNPYTRQAMIWRLNHATDPIVQKGLVATLAAKQAANNDREP